MLCGKTVAGKCLDRVTLDLPQNISSRHIQVECAERETSVETTHSFSTHDQLGKRRGVTIAVSNPGPGGLGAEVVSILRLAPVVFLVRGIELPIEAEILVCAGRIQRRAVVRRHLAGNIFISGFKYGAVMVLPGRRGLGVRLGIIPRCFQNAEIPHPLGDTLPLPVHELHAGDMIPGR